MKFPTSLPLALSRRPRDPSSQVPHDNPLHPASGLPPHRLWVLGHALAVPLAVPLSLSAKLMLLRQEEVPRYSRPPSPQLRGGLPRHCSGTLQTPVAFFTGPGPRRPWSSGAPSQRFLTLSDQGGPAASEANSKPTPLGRRSRSIRGSQRQPASGRIFLHLGRTPGTAGTGSWDAVTPALRG